MDASGVSRFLTQCLKADLCRKHKAAEEAWQLLARLEDELGQGWSESH